MTSFQQNHSPTLKDKLEQIADLETEHSLLGCSVQLRDPEASVDTEEMADYVLQSTKHAIDLIERKDELRSPKPDLDTLP